MAATTKPKVSAVNMLIDVKAILADVEPRSFMDLYTHPALKQYGIQMESFRARLVRYLKAGELIKSANKGGVTSYYSLPKDKVSSKGVTLESPLTFNTKPFKAVEKKDSLAYITARRKDIEANIIAIVKVEGTVDVDFLCENPLLACYALSRRNIANYLQDLVTAKKLFKDENCPNATVYSLHPNQREGREPHKEEQLLEVAVNKSSVKVDVVKATGRVRIEISGIVIEIGVI